MITKATNSVLGSLPVILDRAKTVNKINIEGSKLILLAYMPVLTGHQLLLLQTAK